MTTASFVVGYLCGLVLVCNIICIAFALHMAYTKTDLMLEHLKNCPAVKAQAPLKNGGPWGRVLLIGWIAGIVTFPRYYLKSGGVSINDLNGFPAPLKQKLAAIKWSAIMLIAALAFLVALYQMIEAYKI